MTIFEYDEEQHKQTLLEEGYEDGFNDGKLANLVTLVCRKLRKGKAPEIIADELEEDSDMIQTMCNVACRYAPDYDIQQIVKEYQQCQEQLTSSNN